MRRRRWTQEPREVLGGGIRVQRPKVRRPVCWGERAVRHSAGWVAWEGDRAPYMLLVTPGVARGYPRGSHTAAWPPRGWSLRGDGSSATAGCPACLCPRGPRKCTGTTRGHGRWTAGTLSWCTAPAGPWDPPWFGLPWRLAHGAPCGRGKLWSPWTPGPTAPPAHP